MNMRTVVICVAGFGSLLGGASFAQAQTYATGQTVFASPTGASKYWYSGCIVGEGRNNNSYQVECAGTTWWVSKDNIRTQAPVAAPDPMSPGQIVTPVITPSHPQQAAGAVVAPRPGKMQGTAVAAAPATSNQGGGGYAAEMHRRIEQDKVDARSAKLAVGKYECRVGGQYTFSDLYITGPGSYRVAPGGSGSYKYSAGSITFTSGPYAGTFSQMVDGRTVGISSDGTHNLATQCELTN